MLRVLKLEFSLGQPLLDVLRVLCTATPETRLKCLRIWWFYKDVACINARICLHLLDALHVNIKNGDQSFYCLFCDGLLTRAVIITTKECVFDESVFRNKIGKCRRWGEEVIHAINFASPWLARRERLLLRMYQDVHLEASELVSLCRLLKVQR